MNNTSLLHLILVLLFDLIISSIYVRVISETLLILIITTKNINPMQAEIGD